ncbi:MAG: NUDIX hydrolase [Fidelibacterota bacterium]
MNLTELSIHLEKRLETTLPGKNAHTIMGIKSKPLYNFTNKEEDARPSAVLILIHEHQGDICFFLTERTHTVEHHRGQISLPGGAQESGETLWETALRETNEEIGVATDNIKLLGPLSPLFVIVTGFKIHPFVGMTHSLLEINPEPNEVETVFPVQVNDLVDSNNMKIENRNIRGFDVNVPYFHFNQYKVWGATSMILSEFKTILEELINE